MGKADWLEIVAKQHSEWIEMVNSFGEYEFAEDIVQESYIALYKYAKPENVIDNDKIRRGYMYFTLRNLYFQFYNKRKKVSKIRIDDDNTFLQLPDNTNLEEQEAFFKLCNMIDEEMDNWHWYDKKIFTIYRDTDLSIRKMASETHISWVSIFNTLKNCKNIIKDKFNDDYLDYKNQDYDRI